MNTSYIPVLMEVSLCGSINRAARNLLMPQPQVSHIIRSVEEELGFRLFQRSSAGVTLTPQGERVIESMRIISGELRKIRSASVHCQERKDISIAAIYSRFLFQTFLAFRRRYPEQGVTDCFTEDMYDTVIEKVASQKVRLGIISRTATLSGPLASQLDRFGLETFRLHAGVPMLSFMSRSHPLSGKQSVEIRDVQKYPFVYFHGTDLSFLSQLFHGAEVKPALLVNDRASLLEAISSGKYLSISSTASEKVTEAGKYVYRPIEGVEFPSDICCIRLRSYETTRTEKQFLAFTRKNLSRYYRAEGSVCPGEPGSAAREQEETSL